MGSGDLLPQAPILETERIRLRPVQASDHERLHALLTDFAVVQGTTGKAPTREETWQKTLQIAGNWLLLGYGSWVVTHKDTREMLGIAGLFNAQRELEPKIDLSPEAGWSFFPSAHGQGFARESMQLGLDWFHRHHPSVDYTYAMINLSNKSSHRLAQRLGYVELCMSNYKGIEVGVWRRPKDSNLGS